MCDKIRPLYDRILVKRLEDMEEKSPAGIIIPDTAKEKGQVGEVVAVGAGRRTESGALTPLAIKMGDRVLFAKYAGTDAGKDRIILREDDILGVFEK
ncbi:TPA: co-chaperone GroES [Candidatus Dependentiae bacterium]|nr:MAG: 10 kDa chaperonin [candidate division TM6 bacterium GW2011_GWF2_43_87]HBL98341.1 co-chaperone GroES [Candidatus Dependentiae bacterium]